MENQPTVAVVIPAYNCELFIKEALQSIENQTRMPDRLVVVDDGSTDGTHQRIAEFAKCTPLYIHSLTQANAGAAAARNAGLAECQEELIAFLDGDDTFYPTFLERAADTLKRHRELVLCFPDRDVVDENGKFMRLDLDEPKFRALPTRQLDDSTKILTKSPFVTLASGSIIPMGLMTRRTALQKIGGFDEDLRAVEDKLLLMQLAKLGTFGFIDEPLGIWRRHATNTSSTTNAFKMSFNGDLALEKLERKAVEFKLTNEELNAIRKVRKKAPPRILYAASNEAHPQFFAVALHQLRQRQASWPSVLKACLRYGQRRLRASTDKST